MAQETPSNILYAQAADAIRKLTVAYSTNKNKTPDDISQSINNTLSKFANLAGKTMTPYNLIKRSEIPLSFKQNQFTGALQADINILQDQMDLLSASTVASYNNTRTEVLKASKENLRIRNKIKTLELYSSADDNSLVYFGDTFITEDFIDWTKVSTTERSTILGNGYMGLNLQKQESALSVSTKVMALGDSNGFFGNNQEVKDPTTALMDPTTNRKIYGFVGDTYKAAVTKAVVDDAPSTWFEFEKYEVSQDDRTLAKNFNFKYSLHEGNDLTAHLLSNSSAVTESNGSSTINWADGLADGVLKFYFNMDLGGDKSVNLINLLPYGLTDNTNNPINVVRVATSLNGTDWTILGPENVWISNSIDKKISSVNAENILIGSATWVTDGSLIRYIHFEIEQPKPITVNIGHQYYVTKNEITTESDAIYRAEGPIAPAENPQYYNSASNATVNDLTQRVEVFSGKRWAIGIRDISVRCNVYAKTGVIVSKRFDIPGVIDRVALEADIIIPNGYDTSIPWINFYVSADDGANWFAISRIQDDFLNIPEIIAFNDPTPAELRESGVGYYDVKGTVNSLRFKAVITRPDDAQNSTPILKSYKLKVIKRSS